MHKDETSENCYVCELTQCLDRRAIGFVAQYTAMSKYATYVYVYEKDGQTNYAIRVPGMTVGKIVVDENLVIKEIYITKEEPYKCYTKTEDLEKKFIGTKLKFSA